MQTPMQSVNLRAVEASGLSPSHLRWELATRGEVEPLSRVGASRAMLILIPIPPSVGPIAGLCRLRAEPPLLASRRGNTFAAGASACGTPSAVAAGAGVGVVDILVVIVSEVGGAGIGVRRCRVRTEPMDS